MGLISGKLCRFSLMFSTGFTPLSVFFLYRSPSSSWFFILFYLTQMRFSQSTHLLMYLSLDPSAVFVFGDFNVHHKDQLSYSRGTDRSGDLCYNFSTSNNLTQMVNFPTQTPDCDSHSPAPSDLFISCDASIFSRIAFPLLINSDHVIFSQFSLTFHHFHTGMLCFIALLMTILMLIGMVFLII